MKVIDISKHNGNVDFNKVKASGVQGVMIRAGYGIRHIDPLFKQNVEGCVKAGLHYGFYFYSYALNVEEAKQEANYCLEVIKGYKPTLPVALLLVMLLLNRDTRNGIADSVPATAANIESHAHFLLIVSKLKRFGIDGHLFDPQLDLLPDIQWLLQISQPYSMRLRSVPIRKYL